MNNESEKLVCLIGRVGPAFNLDMMNAAQAALDSFGVPRRLEDTEMTIAQRICFLYGMLVAARSTSKLLAELTVEEIRSFIPTAYTQTEVES
jgi:hypothetical protein